MPRTMPGARMPPLPPPSQPPTGGERQPYDLSYNDSYDSHNPYHHHHGRGAPPMPRAASSRGGHYRETRPHHHGGYHHPYSRPGAAPYGDVCSQPYGGYDYYGESKPYHGTMHHQRRGGAHHVIDPSPRDGEEEGIVHPLAGVHHPRDVHHARSHGHQQPMRPHPPPTMPTTGSNKDATKKPPRPYTEYNIFFQLERERILGELEEEQRKKQAGDEGGGAGAGADAKIEKPEDSTEEAVDEVKKEEDAVEPLNDMNENKDGDQAKDEAQENIASPKEDDAQAAPTSAAAPSSSASEPNNPPNYTAPTSPGVTLNRPSDPNDVLPRPPRFAHLQLAPLWYDSTHRLAQSKLNKSRRKHRKTHGLVGFLDLTRRIAKAWSEVDAETKAYCKRVADRQLRLYKEEMKIVKKQGQGAIESGIAGVASLQAQGASKVQSEVRQQMMLRVKESAVAAEARAKASGSKAAKGGASQPAMPTGSSSYGMPHQPPPPPSGPPGQSSHPGTHPGSYPGSHSSAYPGSHHGYYNKYWGPQSYQPYPGQQAPYPHHHRTAPPHQGGHPSNKPYYPPSVPPLTPTTEYADDPSRYYGPGASAPGMHTPLDELMRRRNVYGTQAAAHAASSRKRSPGTSRAERMGLLRPDKKEVDKVDASTSYLSPADNGTGGKSTAAITPSPSRRHHNNGTNALQDPSLAVPSPPDNSLETPAAPAPKIAAAPSDGATPSTPALGSMTPSQLPMKKRRKKLLEREASAGIDAEAKMTPGNDSAKASDDTSPSSANSNNTSASQLFSLSSPLGMMTPRGSEAMFGASPLSGSSYRKALVGPYLNDGPGADTNSPFPYIDWGSPHDGSPQDGSKGASPQEAGADAHNMGHGGPAMPPHLAVPGSYGHHHHHPPPPPSAHPSSHYPGGAHRYPYHHPASSAYPPSPYLAPHLSDDFADQDVLDLDEEEMQLLWRKLSSHARRKRMRERDAAAVWMYRYGNGSGVPPSPGAFGGGHGNLGMAHSFSSPVERPEIVAGGASAGGAAKDAVAAGGGATSAKEDGAKEEVATMKKDLTLTDLKED